MKQGLLKPSTAKSYRAMVATHLRPAFGDSRSDRLSHAAVGGWAGRKADDIAEGNMAPRYYNNLLNLLHAILAWARHPAQGYLVHAPSSASGASPNRASNGSSWSRTRSGCC